MAFFRPAYVHSLLLCDSPLDTPVPKIGRRDDMVAWNDAVDEYIATQNDFRLRFDIELEAKIGLDGGPLYKTCEALDCDRVEQRDVESLKQCSGCKRVRIVVLSCDAIDADIGASRSSIAVERVRMRAGQDIGLNARPKHTASRNCPRNGRLNSY